MPTPISRRVVLGLLCGALAAGLSACTYVVAPAVPGPPDPLRGARNFILEPLSYGALSIGGTPEPAYLARKDDAQRSSWATDKAEAARLFLDAALGIGQSAGLFIQPPPPPGPGFFLLRGLVSFIEPGTFNGFFNKATVVRMSLLIFNDQGQQIDQVEFQSVIPASLANPSSGGRLRSAGQDLARQALGMIVQRSRS